MSWVRGSLLCAIAWLPGCTLYSVARMEFDSITGFEATPSGEPEQLEYRSEVTRWPWGIRLFEGSGFDWFLATISAAAPGPREVESPAEMLRARVGSLTDLALGDFGRMADMSHRLLWIDARDESILDQVVALTAMARILAEMHVDPLRTPFAAADPTASLEQVDAALRTLESLAPAGRGGLPLADAERREYLAALRVISARPSGSGSQGRQKIRTLLAAATVEEDGLLRSGTRVALADAMACEMSQAIRLKLGAPQPHVREAALLALHRLSGPIAVPFSLRVRATRPTGGKWQYDPVESFRRAWVRLCAQLPREFVFASYDGGPQPIEFLYDTVTTDESPGLRLLALDALSRALGRPVSLERDWADEWWRQESLAREHGGER